MALSKQSVSINFAQGLDLKTDPKQIPVGKFLELENSVFTKAGLLEKRNGNKQLTSLPNTNSLSVTTYSGNLTAIGPSLYAYSSGQQSWITKGNYIPLSLDTLSLIRTNTNQLQVDSVTANNGLICTVFTDNDGVTSTYKYAIADSTTGQNIVAPTLIPVSSGVVTGSPRVFSLSNYFIIVFTNVITAVNHLQFVAINSANPTSVTANADISAAYTPATTVNFDGVVVGSNLYLAWNGNDGGGAIRMAYLTNSLNVSAAKVFAGRAATIMSVCADRTIAGSEKIYATFYTTAGTTGYILAVDTQLNTVLSPTNWVAAGTILNISTAAISGVCSIFYEVSNNYSFDASIASNFISYRTCTQAGTLNTAATILRSVGLASKAFIIDGVIYTLSVYSSAYQPTFFLIDTAGNISAKLAYSNARGYLTLGLPGVSINDDTASIPYLVKDLVQAVNKVQGTAVGAVAGIYAQTGINLVNATFANTQIDSTEIGGNLNLSGGFLWSYDGYALVENGFFVWPDLQLNADGTYHGLTTSAAGGLLTAQTYFYKFVYEWSDNQGNIHRSAPSIPVSIATTGATSTNTLIIPTLRLTYKTANPVKIVVYRASTAQGTYYQTTSVSSPKLNSITTDTVTVTDTAADSAIIGNSIIYITGGVIENISPPATDIMALYRSRLFLLDSEDRNLLWYSKQVIETTPVEMSDLFTIYIAPTTGAQGSTGDITALSAMDDKLIIFKKDAIYYITGNGPDNTGSQNDFSEPVFITSTVGCSNQASIVFMPQGLMFQSDKGIWLLGRDLSTNYIGNPVDDFALIPVTSAINVPGTNEVRFTLSSGITLMYDYFYAQWGSFDGIPAISSTLYQSLHTFIDSYGRVFQENVGSYLDGSRPVLMRFKTSWLNFTGLQGFERAYFFYLLGTYKSPHLLEVSIAYDYADSPSQTVLITPINYNLPYGVDPYYGNPNPYGGNAQLEQWQVFLARQKCQSFQITIQEQFDPSFGTVAGAGFTMSGLNLTVGMKGQQPKLPAVQSVG